MNELMKRIFKIGFGILAIPLGSFFIGFFTIGMIYELLYFGFGILAWLFNGTFNSMLEWSGIWTRFSILLSCLIMGLLIMYLIQEALNGWK